MYICVTHVDAATKIPCFAEPMRKGPAFPDVKGLNLEWWDQSKWPLTHPDQFPRFYGTCDDDADTTIMGVVEVLTEEDYNRHKAEEEYARLPHSVPMRQARLALLKAGLLDQVLAAFETLPEELKSAAKIEWEFASEVSKGSPLVAELVKSLDLTEEQVTDLFVSASQISINDFIPVAEPEVPEGE